MQREECSVKFGIGSQMPKFVLPATDGNDYSDQYFESSKARLVIFTCNHCPYVKGSEDFFQEAILKYKDYGLKTVAISSNDAVQYPEDSFEKMKDKSESLGNPFPYLYDETQDVARSFDAACTPECYLFDSSGKLVFHGTVNNSPRDPSAATEKYLEKAISQLINDEEVNPSFVHPMGCSIKWKQ